MFGNLSLDCSNKFILTNKQAQKHTTYTKQTNITVVNLIRFQEPNNQEEIIQDFVFSEDESHPSNSCKAHSRYFEQK